MSEICTAFGCAPLVAEQQPWPLVSHVMDYRNAIHARDLLDQGAKGFDELAKQEGLMQLLLRMTRAQLDPDAQMGDVLAAAQRRSNESDERNQDTD